MPPNRDPTVRTDHAVSRLAAIVDSSFDAIISKDLDSVITSWNPAAARLFGYSAEEAVGQSILKLIPQNLRAEETHIIARIRRGERVESYETMRRRKDGSLVAVSLTVSPVRDENGGIIGASKIARDVSGAKEDQRRIRSLIREVNHRVKNQFAVILSMIRETVRRTGDPSAVEDHIRDRIMALSRSHDLLVASEWSGASLEDLIKGHLEPFDSNARIALSGPHLMLAPGAVQNLGMAFHELGTNALKYGALSHPGGRISISSEIATDDAGRKVLDIIWDEIFEPGADSGGRRKRHGFGTVVLQRVTPQGLNGTATYAVSPGHVHWMLRAPLETSTAGFATAD